MKKISLVLLMIIALVGCREEFDDIGEPFDRAEGLSGTWTLVSVVQNDENAISKNFPVFVQSLDITSRAGFNDYTLILNQDADGTPTTFEELNTDAPSIIGASSGNWSIDDPELPEQVVFTSGSGSTFDANIATYIGLNEGRLVLRKTRFEEGNAVLSYVYTFEK